MDQSASTTAGRSACAGPQGAERCAIVHARPQNLCTFQYTKKNDRETREALDKANASGAHTFLTTSVPEMMYAM